MEHIIEYVVIAITVVLSVFNTIRGRLQTKTSRTEELKTVVSLAFDTGLGYAKQPNNNIPLRQLVFDCAVAIDIRRDGKRDFDDKTLRLAVDGEGHRRGLW